MNAPMTLDALLPTRLFDGETWREDVAVLIADGAVLDVIPASQRPSHAAATPLPGLLAPGFVDVQVNGGGGALLNETPTPEAVATIARAHRRFGTTGLLPTVITDRPEVTRAAVEAVRAAIAAGTPGVLGVHVEGPFLNPARKGVHDPAFMRAPDADDLALLTGPGLGAVLVTLAPERVPDAAIARLAEAGVR
ncbi:amidohydrolase family protein, partial [Methylopila musalis]